MSHYCTSLRFPLIHSFEFLSSVSLSVCLDVKPSNVLINMQGQVKMCDFGISGYLVDSVAKTMDAGCKPYMAVSLGNPPPPQFIELGMTV